MASSSVVKEIVADVCVTEETELKVMAGNVVSEMVRVKEVVLVVPPPMAVTVIVELPRGVEAGVVIVRVVEQLGEQETGENEAVAPDGRPEAEKVNEAGVPVVRVAVIVV